MQEKSTLANISDSERIATALGGALLAAYGISQRSKAGTILAAAGGALIVRGATGYCPGYAAAGIDMSRSDDTRVALAGSRGTRVESAVTIMKPHDELYRFWRDLENLPRFMPHLVSVRNLGGNRSHWEAESLRGRTVEWDAEIINDTPNELIGWRTLNGADVVSAGSVRFKPSGHDGETIVTVHMQYEPPAGKLGATIAWMFGAAPSQTIREDLRRFKSLMEAGELPTTRGQSRGEA